MVTIDHAISDREQRLNAVLADYLDGIESGQPDDRPALLARHPDLATDLQAFLAEQDGMADLASPLRSVIRPQPVELAPGVLGDYRISREVGRGGMGIVYEAEQISLSRRVALKVLPFAATMDPKHLQRFHNEAKAAAGLHHEHIVPVFAVGCERGVHYYAMQFIDGSTLAQTIEGLNQEKNLNHRATEDTEKKGITAPMSSRCSLCLCGKSSFRTIAALIADAADALEYAHSVGIVHRDVKPGNLLIDAAGKLWIADFGLARFGPDAGLTMTGDLLGTLRYMAPEQALAKHGLADHRVDVYGLGCTLYELLTGKPAVGGEDKQEILKRIAFEEPVVLRKLDKAIPAELETIALKALAKEPADRFSTARELADDLRRFLADRPIIARPPGLSLHLARWARRHRAAVAATVVCLFVAIVALAIGTAVIWQKQQETTTAYEVADEQRRLATEQRQKAVESLKDAQAAVNQLLSRVGRDKLADVPYMETVRRELLTDALRFYLKFLQRKSDDPELRLETARAYLGAGALQLKLGESGRAEENVRQGIALLNELLAQPPGRPEYHELLAEGWLDLGHIRLETNHPREAEDAYNTARRIAAKRVADSPDSRASLDQLARACADLGTTYARSGRLSQAAESYQEARRWCEQLTAIAPEDLFYQQTLATVTANLGNLLSQLGDKEEGEKRIRHAAELQERVVASEPGPKQRAYLANVYRDLGLRQRDRGRLEEAVETHQTALGLWSQLHREFPHVPGYAHAHARILFFAGQDLAFLGRDGPALQHLSDAERLYAQLAKDFPAKQEYGRELSWCYFERGWLLAASNNPQVRNPEAAIEPATKAVELAPDDGKCWAGLGMAYYRAGQWQDALRALDQASRRPQAAGRIDLFFLAMTHWQLDHKEDARRWYGQAVAWMDKNRTQDAQLGRFRVEAATLLGVND